MNTEFGMLLREKAHEGPEKVVGTSCQRPIVVDTRQLSQELLAGGEEQVHHSPHFLSRDGSFKFDGCTRKCGCSGPIQTNTFGRREAAAVACLVE